MCVFKYVFSGQPSKAGDLFQPRQEQCKCRYLVVNIVILPALKPHMLIEVPDHKHPPILPPTTCQGVGVDTTARLHA
jgi:hypothetical protein